MAKYVIEWDAGYGHSEDVVEADTLEEAEIMAWETAEQEALDNVSASAREYNEEED